MGKKIFYTAGHQKRVTQLACAIAREIDLSEKNSIVSEQVAFFMILE
jgi:HD-GYP domain-containing protein (c-di-GMP phosphodiesterase class II)